MKPIPSELEKEYPSRGPLHQFRFKTATAFHCFRCGVTKKSKLITIYGNDWTKHLCNGCYGRLLSIFTIKAREQNDDEKSQALADVLLTLLNQEQRRQAERLFHLAEHRAGYLLPKSVTFIATSEQVSKTLESVPDLEWSPAISGLCKAFEAELIERIIIPLRHATYGLDLRDDLKDKDIGRVAKFCHDPSIHHPELGSVNHFLQTVINSERRRTSSILMQAFIDIARSWSRSHWILDLTGLHTSLTRLSQEYRNKAAHIDELSQLDYRACREFVIGDNGILWQLVDATEQHK